MFTIADIARLNLRVALTCDPCGRRETIAIPWHDDGSPLARHIDREIDDVWRSPGFRCRKCRQRGTFLTISRPTKSNRRWVVVHTVQ